MFNSKFNMLLLLMVGLKAMEMRRDIFSPFDQGAIRNDGQTPFIVVMGQTGVGKSRTLSNAAGDDPALPANARTFQWSGSMESCTTQALLKQIRLFGNECVLQVMDTCGLMDTQGRTTEQVRALVADIEQITAERARGGRTTEGLSVAELQKLREEQNYGGIHLLVIVTNDGSLDIKRSSEEQKEQFAQIAAIMGEGWEDNAVVVATHWRDPELSDDVKRAQQADMDAFSENPEFAVNPEDAYLMTKPEGHRRFETYRERVEYKANTKIRSGIAEHNINNVWTPKFKAMLRKYLATQDDDASLGCHVLLHKAAEKVFNTQEFKTRTGFWKKLEEGPYNQGCTPLPQVKELPVFLLDNTFSSKCSSDTPDAQEIWRINMEKQKATIREVIQLAFTNEPMNTQAMKAVMSQRDKELMAAIEAQAQVEAAQAKAEAEAERANAAEEGEEIARKHAEEAAAQAAEAEAQAAEAREEVERKDLAHKKQMEEQEAEAAERDARLMRERKAQDAVRERNEKRAKRKRDQKAQAEKKVQSAKLRKAKKKVKAAQQSQGGIKLGFGPIQVDLGGGAQQSYDSSSDEAPELAPEASDSESEDEDEQVRRELLKMELEESRQK